MLAALYQRERTGRGRTVDLALFDCGVALTSYYGLEALARGIDPPRYGPAPPSLVPSGVFAAGAADAADHRSPFPSWRYARSGSPMAVVSCM